MAKWLLADWRNFAVTLLAALYIFANWFHIPRLRADLADTAAQLEATQLAHLGTITNYIDAGNKAKADAEANAARVKAEQEVITHEVTRDLRSDLAAVTARFDRLRARNAAAGNPGRADPAGLPGSGAAPGRAAGAPGNFDLRAAGSLTCPEGFVCLTIDQAERASQDAVRHNALIDWVIGQSAIAFTAEEPAE